MHSGRQRRLLEAEGFASWEAAQSDWHLRHLLLIQRPGRPAALHFTSARSGQARQGDRQRIGFGFGFVADQAQAQSSAACLVQLRAQNAQ